MRERTISNRTLVTFLLALLLSAAGVLVGDVAQAVPGSTTDCNNEARIDQGGDDFLVEAGPGVLYVGADRGTMGGGHIGVCVGAPSRGVVANSTVDDDDVPQKRNSTNCAVDILGCKVTAFTVWSNDGDDVALVSSDRSGLPAGNGTTELHAPNCIVGVATSC